MKLSLVLLFSFFSICTSAQPSNQDIRQVIAEINKLRNSGCQCGDEWMPPVQPVKWNNDLYRVSNKYAKYMYANDHFDHISKSGEDLGDRLNKIGYDWMKIGENLGFGYHDFYSVLEAWIESPSHCTMLMDADMTDMGLSKHRIYWVQSFSKSSKSIAGVSAY